MSVDSRSAKAGVCIEGPAEGMVVGVEFKDAGGNSSCLKAENGDGALKAEGGGSDEEGSGIGAGGGE